MRFFKKKVGTTEEEILTRTYRCPNHPQVVLFRVNTTTPEPPPTDTEKIKCPVGGEEIEVPKYKPSDKI